MVRTWNQCRPSRRHAAGFSLLELLLAFGLGLSVCALMLQSVLAEGQNGQRLARLLRERQAAGRALALLRSDLQRATAVAATAGPDSQDAACRLAGRAVLLHLQTAQGPITYSVGSAPEPIWRGQVLMRCGPAYGLGGELSSGAAQNRVLLDGLAPGGLEVEEEAPGVMRLKLRQAFPLRSGGQLPIRLEMRAPAPSG